MKKHIVNIFLMIAIGLFLFSNASAQNAVSEENSGKILWELKEAYSLNQKLIELLNVESEKTKEFRYMIGTMLSRQNELIEKNNKLLEQLIKKIQN